MLAIQITKDTGTEYFQLSKICDFARLFRSDATLDPAEVLAAARTLKSERMLLFSARLAQSVLGVSPPAEVLRAMRSHPALDALVAYARDCLFATAGTASGATLTPDAFRWAIRERLRDKLYPYYHQYIVKAIEPSDADRRFMAVPDRLSFLYYLVRPLRVLRRYASGRGAPSAAPHEEGIPRGTIHGEPTSTERK
jgi:hypothetical protein